MKVKELHLVCRKRWCIFVKDQKIKFMQRIVKIVKIGQDDSNLFYWLSLSYAQRLEELEKLRIEVNQRMYGNQQGFQRVYRVVKREQC
jgi:hypothetical protein